MKLYKYRSLDNRSYIEDILANQRLYAPPYYRLNDPFEGQFLHAAHFPPNELFKNPQRIITQMSIDDMIGPEDYFDVRVCSLSSAKDEMLLWSLYAGGHTGIAVEIDNANVMHKLHEVIYNPTLQLYDDPRYAGPSIHQALTSKTLHWKYEAEYRLITPDEYISVKGSITRVIAGARCKPSDITWLQAIAPSGVHVVKASFGFQSITIEVPE